MTPPPEAPADLNHRAKVIGGIKNHMFLSAIIGVVLLLALVFSVSYGVVTTVNSHAQAVATAQHNRVVASAKARAAIARTNAAIAAANAKAANAALAAKRAERAAKRAANKPAAAPVVVVPASAVAPAASALTNCGDGVFAGSDTSCPFALNVQSAWMTSGATTSITAYSPVTGQSYAMYCRIAGAGSVICTGGNNAYVQF